jgi:hypothetical protein
MYLPRYGSDRPGWCRLCHRQPRSRLRHCAVLKASWNYHPTTATFDHRWSILTRIRGCSEGSITMLQTLRETLMLSSKDSLARAFLRLGWAGLGIQIVIGSIPVLLAIYALIFGRNTGVGTRAGSLLIECLTIAGLIVMVFATIWSYRYTRLGRQIADPARRPSEFEIRRVAWIGVAASAVGILFSMLVILFEVVQLLIYFLRAPQAGVPAIQTTGGGQASWVSAADVMNLLALTLSSVPSAKTPPFRCHHSATMTLRPRRSLRHPPQSQGTPQAWEGRRELSLSVGSPPTIPIPACGAPDAARPQGGSTGLTLTSTHHLHRGVHGGQGRWPRT